MNNFFTVHNDWRSMGIGLDMNVAPFQIDANMGWTAAVQEMLLFSKPGFIKLLPALPERWMKGMIKGMLARGSVEVSIEWDMVQGHINATLYAKYEQTLKIKLPKDIINLNVVGAKPVKYQGSVIEGLVLSENTETVIRVHIKMK